MNDNTIQGGAVMQAIKGVQGLFADVNKDGSGDNQNIKQQDEYTSKFSDEEIITLKKDWVRTYQGYYSDIKKSQDLAFDYWVGKQ
jgi:hypothetical protein